MTDQPDGTVTFLFTDIEGSTHLAQKYPNQWEDFRKRHNDILQAAMDAHAGYVFQIIGDAFCVAFQTASDAVRAAVKVQIDLYTENWGETPIKVRMGIHTGQAQLQISGQYHGYLSMSRVQRLCSAANGGQVLVSLTVQELVRDYLPETVSLRDLGKRRLKDLIRPEQIFQLAIAELPVDFPPIKTLDAYRHNLPVQLTSFIGREKEIAEVRQAVAAHRLVTLTGAGGTGKTRLSLQVAADLLEQISDGVWVVELAPLQDAELVPQGILSVFGLQDQPGLTTLQLLCDFLREKKLLVVLDNCEHLLEKCAQVVITLLNAAPELKILATSREALGVSGELIWYVPSLSLPEEQRMLVLENFTQYEAVKLFIDRAQLAQKHFLVTSENAPAIAQICHRLDGIPLAIELAAARVKMLDVEQISRRLDDRFHLLTGGSRTALPRHQTLRAAIDWSYNMLPEPEKVLFRSLSVFAGGWDLEDVEQVCAEQGEVFDLLGRLVDKSLVVADSSSGTARYHQLETTRQYARDRLAEAGEVEKLQTLHLDWFLVLAERGVPGLQGSAALFWMKRLERELDNFRAALDWSLDARPSIVPGLRLANALAEYWYSYENIHWNENFLWLAKAEQRSQELGATADRARLLYYLGTQTFFIKGNWLEARALFEQSLEMYRKLGSGYQAEKAYAQSWLGFGFFWREPGTGLTNLDAALQLARESGDRRCEGWVLNFYSEVKFNQGDLKTAFEMTERGAALYSECGDQLLSANCIFNLGMFHTILGHYQEAKILLEQVLGVFITFKNIGFAYQVLVYLGEACRGLDDYPQAETCYRESIAMKNAIGKPSRQFISVYLNLGYTVLRQGDDDQAFDCFSQALSLIDEESPKNSFVNCLAGFAALAAARNLAEVAAALYGIVDAQIKSMADIGQSAETQIDPVDRKEDEYYQAKCRARLGAQAYHQAFERGQELSLQAGLELVRDKLG